MTDFEISHKFERLAAAAITEEVELSGDEDSHVQVMRDGLRIALRVEDSAWWQTFQGDATPANIWGKLHSIANFAHQFLAGSPAIPNASEFTAPIEAAAVKWQQSCQKA